MNKYFEINDYKKLEKLLMKLENKKIEIEQDIDYIIRKMDKLERG